MAGEERALIARVFEDMRERIESGVWPPDSEVPSVPQLAREFGVGQSTAGAAALRLRFFGFLKGPQGGQTRVASPEVLNLARAAWATAKMAREMNEQDG